MKKQFLMITLVSAGILLFSCKKEETPAPSPVQDQDLQAWVKFDNNYNDASGKLVAGTTTGSPTFVNDRNGNVNSALHLDGSSKVVIKDVTYEGLTTTVTAWLKYEITGGYAEYAIYASGNGIAIRQNNTKFEGVVSNPSTNNASPAAGLSANWHHIAVTYDGTDIKLYVDGTLSATKNHPGTVNDGKRDFIFGTNQVSYWTGSIDDFRVYSRILTESEIQKIAAE